MLPGCILIAHKKYQQHFLYFLDTQSVLRDEKLFLLPHGYPFLPEAHRPLLDLHESLMTLFHYSDGTLHILSGCQHRTMSSMITDRHNIACRLMLKAIKAGSLWACFVQTDFGSGEHLALQNIKIPEGCTNRTILDWHFPSLSPTAQILTASRPEAYL